MAEAIGVRLEGLLQAAARARLELSAGESRSSEIGALYRSAADLFRLDRLSEVQLELSGAAGENAKRLRLLLEGLAEGRGICTASGEIDQLATWWSHAHVSVGEERVPVAGAAGAMAETSDLALRHEIEEAWLTAIDGQEPLLEGIHSGVRRAVEELGYGEFPRSVQILTGVDLRNLEAEAERFLHETADEYFDLLDWHLPRLAGVERGDARAADGLRLARAAPYDPLLPGGDLPDRARALLRESGFDPTAGGRVRVRTVPPGSRNPGATVHPLRVPEEVAMVLRPGPGRATFASVLRAVGRACHAVHTDAGLPFEYRRLGDDSVPLAIGMLFEGLLESRVVLTRELGIGSARAAEQRRLGALLDLLRARSDAARLGFELWWHAEAGAPDRGARWAELMTDATGLLHDPRAALADVLHPFRSADRLRAEQLRSAIAVYLRERCDEDWHRNPAAEPILRELMAPGRSFSADELAIQIGAGTLSMAPVRDRTAELIG